MKTRYKIQYKYNFWHGHMYWLKYRKYGLWWTVKLDTNRDNLIRFTKETPYVNNYIKNRKLEKKQRKATMFFN